ncbi:MAG: sugar phosphate isomerase/epimerase family protein [bacterium]
MPVTTTRRGFFKNGVVAAAGASVLGMQPQIAQAIAPVKRGFGSHMKLSCAAYSYRKYLKEQNPPTMTIEDFLDECVKLGLEAAEPTSYYFPTPLTQEFLLNFKRKAFLLGLDISGTAVGNTFTYPPGPERDKELQHVNDWVDHAAVFGAPCIRIFAGQAPDGMSVEQARKYAIETTEEACAYAATRGVFLALENHGGIVPDAKGLLAIVREVESDWFGVNLDTGNFVSDDPYADIAETAPYAVTVQVKVHIKTPSGQKVEADFERILGILADSGYRGYVALEYEGSEEPKEAIPRHIEELQSILSRM